MNDAIQIIQAQYSYAQKKYPNLQQVNQFEFTINFGRSLDVFRIVLQNNYPEGKPKVQHGNKSINTPMTTNWVRAFQLVHLIEHLEILSNYPKYQRHMVNADKVRQAMKGVRPGVACDPNQREILIKDLPEVKNADAAASDMANKKKKAQDNIDKMTVDTVDTVDKLNQIIDKNKRLMNEMRAHQGGGNELLGQAKIIKIQELRDEANKQDQVLNDLEEKLSAQKISLSDYAKKLKEAKQIQLYNTAIASHLEMTQ